MCVHTLPLISRQLNIVQYSGMLCTKLIHCIIWELTRRWVCNIQYRQCFPPSVPMHGWMSSWVWDPWLQRLAAYIFRAGSCTTLLLFFPLNAVREGRKLTELPWHLIYSVLTSAYRCHKNEQGKLSVKPTLPFSASLDLNSEWWFFLTYTHFMSTYVASPCSVFSYY